MEDEVDQNASHSSGLDSFFPDGQERQSVAAMTQERFRHLPEVQVFAVPADQNRQLDHGMRPDPNLVGHTLTVTREGSSAQARLAFNAQPGVSSSSWTSSRRRATSVPLVLPVNPSWVEESRRGADRGNTPAQGDQRTSRARSPVSRREHRGRRDDNYFPDYADMDPQFYDLRSDPH